MRTLRPTRSRTRSSASARLTDLASSSNSVTVTVMGEPGSGSSDQPSTSSAAAAASASGGSSEVDMSDPAFAGMTADELKKFVEGGRTGRRNAVPDVSEEAGAASASGVADAMGSLSMKDESGASTSAAAKGS